jgi:hypothetical protein
MIVELKTYGSPLFQIKSFYPEVLDLPQIYPGSETPAFEMVRPAGYKGRPSAMSFIEIPYLHSQLKHHPLCERSSRLVQNVHQLEKGAPHVVY